MNKIDGNLIRALQSGDNTIIKKIYLNYKEDFFRFAKKHQLSDDEILDIYQDAILALKENAILGKITPSNSSVKTYFFSIGKFMIYDVLRKHKKMLLTNDFIDEIEEHNYDFLFNRELNTNQKKLQQAFKTLGEKCKQVLTLFYYNNYSLDEIKEQLQYSSKDVVKSQKHRCLQSLKNKIL